MPDRDFIHDRCHESTKDYGGHWRNRVIVTYDARPTRLIRICFDPVSRLRWRELLVFS